MDGQIPIEIHYRPLIILALTYFLECVPLLPLGMPGGRQGQWTL